MTDRRISPHPFDRLVASGDGRFRLAEAALAFAADHQPGLEPEAWLERLDVLGAELQGAGGATAEERLAALRSVLIEGCGLRGNAGNYYDPANSFLNRVLETGFGIPISLSVVWIEAARAAGWGMYGVGLPGHFVIALEDPAGADRWLDPFNGGRELEEEECLQIVRNYSGADAGPAELRRMRVSDSDILTRMLNNLLVIYMNQSHWPAARLVLDRQLALRPAAPELHEQVRFVRTRLAELN